MAMQTALTRVERACQQLRHDGQPVTFTTVAERAGISRTSLYRDSDLRSVVEEYRLASNDPRTLSGLKSEIAHLRTAVEVLAEKVRRHEAQLRGLSANHSSRRRAN
jgi:hypothetical protein